jgi:DsbC/DsbD-like thiol-disulfide interchange protein
VGKTLFPRPQMIKSSDDVTYGYEGRTVLFVEITAPAEMSSGGQAMFRSEINWLVCKSACLMGRTSVVTNLSVGRQGESKNADPVVEQFKKRIPGSLKDESGATISYDQNVLTVRLPAHGYRKAELFPIEVPGVTLGEPSITTESDVMTVKIPVEVNPGNAQGQSPVAAGVLALGTRLEDPAFEFEFPLSAP